MLKRNARMIERIDRMIAENERAGEVRTALCRELRVGFVPALYYKFQIGRFGAGLS